MGDPHDEQKGSAPGPGLVKAALTGAEPSSAKTVSSLTTRPCPHGFLEEFHWTATAEIPKLRPRVNTQLRLRV